MLINDSSSFLAKEINNPKGLIQQEAGLVGANLLVAGSDTTATVSLVYAENDSQESRLT